MGPGAKNIGDLGVGLGDWDWDRRKALLFFFRVFQAGEGKRKAREAAPDTGKRLQGRGGGAKKITPTHTSLIAPFRPPPPPPNTPLNDATNYSGSSKRSNCQ